MPDQMRVCQHCGAKFLWTEQEERDYTADEATGGILDGYDPKNQCKSCLGKQDG